MPNFDRAIKYTYPDIKNNQYTLIDRGQGVVIEDWTYPAPKPNVADLSELANKFDDVVALEREKNQLITEKLAKTDWYYIRNLRTGKNVPDSVTSQNAATYTRLNEIDTEIAALLA